MEYYLFKFIARLIVAVDAYSLAFYVVISKIYHPSIADPVSPPPDSSKHSPSNRMYKYRRFFRQQALECFFIEFCVKGSGICEYFFLTHVSSGLKIVWDA